MTANRIFRSIIARITSTIAIPRTAQARSSSPIAEESLARYRLGGYHAVRIGDRLQDGHYQVICKLGYGVYSTVWLVKDSTTKRHVALKILTADAYFGEHDTFELSILEHIKSINELHPGEAHVLGLLDHFKHEGPHGSHLCLVFKAMGPSLIEYRRLFPLLRIPIPILKKIARQMLLALSFLHTKCGIIHTDIKPSNILLETTQTDKFFERAPSTVFEPSPSARDPQHDFYMKSEQTIPANEVLESVPSPPGFSVRIADFGTASYFDKHLTDNIQPVGLRAPEVVLRAEWDYKVDIWNLGCLIWELAEGAMLFDGCASPKTPYTADAHLAQIQGVLGPMPLNLIRQWENASKYYNDSGALLVESPFPPTSFAAFINSPELQDEAEQKQFLEFIGSMLKWDPKERLDADGLLKSEWL
ncbi:Serine/threonine-protein kinase SRPK [Cyphellophora attinorum]|uniref:non-specific serine/threonine protein kinase n=1 Tax=Cyphellophora attinorum TaxID=1664694 RepID=A0A0N1H2M5_9EURO|nr:Serine/threonine-protein kinase SRPK [Phialophora attinorum]KPI35537.1 Serine/threonine-protein kinase SRPK [Phialophora attinorum]